MDSLGRLVKTMLFIIALLFVLQMVGFSVAYFTNAHRIEENRKTLEFLCAQKENLRQSVIATRQLLNSGIRIRDIPLSLIVQRYERDKKTVALMGLILDCPPP